MAVIRAFVFIASLLAIPVLSFLIVLCIVINIVKDQQERDEGSF